MKKLSFNGQNSAVVDQPSFLVQAPVQNIEQKFDVDEIWKIVKEQLRLYVSETSISAWYPNVYLSKIDGGIAEIVCDSNYKRDWIDTNNRAILKKLLLNTTGQNLEIVLTLKSSNAQNTTNTSRESKYEYFDPTQNTIFSSTTNIAPIQESTFQKSSLNNTYTFNNFIVGSGNQLAHAVGEAVADSPGTAYNPVFYYGSTGVGKTHLMLAIGNKILERSPEKKIVYSPIEKFLNELIEAIRKHKNEEFRRKYREVDVLIIDDIQFVGSYPKTQDEIFNTFNTLHMSNKQIIMASDRPPLEIPNITDRLRSRFAGGMVIDIQPPDLETRVAILKQKSEQLKFTIPDETIFFIAQNIESNIRELEGAITKVVSVATFNRTIPTQEDIEGMLQIDLSSKRRRIKPKKIIDSVCEIFDVSIKDLKSDKRPADIAMARQIAMFFLREELKMSLDKVAAELNRKDHTTVLHAVEKVKKLSEREQAFREKLDKCRHKIRE